MIFRKVSQLRISEKKRPETYAWATKHRGNIKDPGPGTPK